MLRRSMLVLFLSWGVLISAGAPFLAQGPKGGLPEQAPHIKDKIEELRKTGEAKKWTFEVGNTKAAHQDLAMIAGTRVPPGINVAETAAKKNATGAKWLQADHKARDEFNKKNPGVLPGLKVEPRVQSSSFSKKTRFDWRDYQKVTAVRDQQSCGSCWDFAAMGAFECNYLIRNDETIDVSEQQILDCSGAGNCTGGWWMGAFDYLIKKGVGTEQSYPYKNVQGKCTNVTSPYKAVSWAFVAQDGAMPTPDAMKEALCKYGPLAVAVNATPAFQHYTKGVFNEFAEGNINHGVLLVGWDDAKGKNGAWAIRNSWSTNWGEQGFMWIEYGSNRIGDHAAWVESESKHYELMILLANDYRVKQGEEVTVPIYLINPTNVNNLGWSLHYDTNIVSLAPPQVVQGNLPLSLFEANFTNEPGKVSMGFAQNKGAFITNKGAGTVAVLRFKALGAPGTKTPLDLSVLKINDPEKQPLAIKVIDGSIEIVKDHRQIPPGSCTGQERLNVGDARCALQMSVGNRPVALNMDVDGDGQVTSLDAAIILQRVADQVRTGQ